MYDEQIGQGGGGSELENACIFSDFCGYDDCVACVSGANRDYKKANRFIDRYGHGLPTFCDGGWKYIDEGFCI